MGFRDPVRRSTLADANEARDWRIYAELAQRLIGQARRLYVNEALGFDLANTIYALASTTIDLCLAVFPWAHFRTTKAAVKMHTLLDLRGNIPSFIHVSDGKLHDVHALDPAFARAGSAAPGGGRDLRHGSGLFRFRPAPCAAPGRSLLRHPSQIEHGCSSGLFRTLWQDEWGYWHWAAACRNGGRIYLASNFRIRYVAADVGGRVRFHYTLVAVIGRWQSGEGVPGDDADEVAWLTRAEIVDQGLPTAPALLPLIDLALSRRG
jgi:hypothetical protein